MSSSPSRFVQSATQSSDDPVNITSSTIEEEDYGEEDYDDDFGAEAAVAESAIPFTTSSPKATEGGKGATAMICGTAMTRRRWLYASITVLGLAIVAVLIGLLVGGMGTGSGGGSETEQKASSAGEGGGVATEDGTNNAIITTAVPSSSTDIPTGSPSQDPSESPTVSPTSTPSAAPTRAPTAAPTAAPTTALTAAPTSAPSNMEPTASPSVDEEVPTVAPTETLTTVSPTEAPSTSAPSTLSSLSTSMTLSSAPSTISSGPTSMTPSTSTVPTSTPPTQEEEEAAQTSKQPTSVVPPTSAPLAVPTGEPSSSLSASNPTSEPSTSQTTSIPATNTPTTTLSPSTQPPPTPLLQHKSFSFYLMGDIPYMVSEEQQLRRQLRNITSDENARSVTHPNLLGQFAVHVGDLQFAKRSRCRKTYFEKIRGIFTDLSSLPTLVLAGDNDWNDCKNPDTAWNFYMRYFVGMEQNWTHSLPITRWEDGRNENWELYYEGVLFVSVNLVGGTILNQTEWDTRNLHNVDWVTMVWNKYYNNGFSIRGVIIFGHSRARENVRPFFEGIADLFGDIDVHVMYMHGDGHMWGYTDKLGRQLGWERFMTLQVDNGRRAPPLRVEIRSSDDGPWTVENEHQFVFMDGLVRVDRRGGTYLNETAAPEGDSELPGLNGAR